jgi:pimeloyl-ACP methyl ester carboxylesterase
LRAFLVHAAEYRASMTVEDDNVDQTRSEEALSADGIPIRFEATGSGTRALVFVHGWSCDRTYWRHQLPEFATAHRVVAVDLAGHGASGAGRSSWTMPSFGADVVAVADALELHDMVLIGHSMGGDVIVEAALSLGDRVAGIVWVDTYHRLTEPETPEQVAAFLDPFRTDFVGTTRALVRRMFPSGADAGLVGQVAGAMSAAPPDIAFDTLRHAFSNEGRVMAVLPNLNVPVVAINPDYRPTDEASLRRYGVETVVASSVGHFLMLEDPDQFNQLLAGVLARITSPSVSRPRA